MAYLYSYIYTYDYSAVPELQQPSIKENVVIYQKFLALCKYSRWSQYATTAKVK